jgi:hypothetical protein
LAATRPALSWQWQCYGELLSCDDLEADSSRVSCVILSRSVSVAAATLYLMQVGTYVIIVIEFQGFLVNEAQLL